MANRHEQIIILEITLLGILFMLNKNYEFILVVKDNSFVLLGGALLIFNSKLISKIIIGI